MYKDHIVHVHMRNKQGLLHEKGILGDYLLNIKYLHLLF